MQDTSSVNTNIFSKPALVTSLNDSYVGKEMYTHGRNVIPYSISGDEGTLGNEPSNTFCVDIPNTFIGSIDLNDDRVVVFSSTGTLSEIGIVDIEKCTYTSVLKSSCLGFKLDKVMQGVAKKLFNNDIVITFGQKDENIYRLNLSEIPYKYTVADDECETKEYTKEVDCEEMLLFRKLKYPCIDIERGLTGNLPNGVYNVTLAYMVDNQVFTDYYRPSQKVQIFEQINGTSSINVHIDNLDRNFDKYQLVLIGNVKGTKTAAIIGEYPTFQSTVQISDFLTDKQVTIPLAQLVQRKNTWKSAGIITSNSNYLLLSDLTKRATLNYQPQAMKIDAEYVVKQVLADYYTKSPEDINYYGDENYDFYIQWLFNDGEESKLFHIPGRRATAVERAIPSGTDVYEWDEDIKPSALERWQTENTAGKAIPTLAPFVNNSRIAYIGRLGYFESTELYPDNKELFGNDACTPIRYHKFPDEEKVRRYETIGGKTYINIKGIRFSNVEYPKDTNGNRIEGIVGYQIWRSDRKGGNKTVISTGLMTNVRTYQDQQNNEEIMFANYPYNDLSPDAFLSTTQTTYNGNKEKNFNAVTGYYQNRFNYYSPHSLYNLKYKHGSEFRFLSEEIGQVDGNFEEVFGHPTSKLISNFSFWAAAMIGVAEAYLEATGAKSTSTTVTNRTEITAGVPPSITKVTETSVTEAPKTALEIAGKNLADLAKKIVDAITSGDLGSIASIVKLIKEVILFIANAGIATVLFTTTAMKYAQNLLDIIYNFISFRQYAYQYNSHALFSATNPITDGNKRRKAVQQPEYLSSNLHTINGVTFNNFGKQESVYVELNRNVALPSVKDDTRRTISQFGSCGQPTKKVRSTASAYYVASKIPNPNQYGQLGTSEKVLVSNCVGYVGTDDTYTTAVIFGGDAIIAKQSIITKHPFFRQNLAVDYGNQLPTNFPPGTEFNYNLYRNVAYPRFWIDTTKYDYSSLLRKKVINFSTFSRTATSKHNLDCKEKDTEDVFAIDNAYFYLYNNGVLEFYAECDYNISFREKTEVPHYSDNNHNLSEIMRSTNLVKEEQFKLDKAFSDIYVNEVYGEQIPTSFNSLKESTSYPNAIIYSLPAFNLQTFDNWQYFLPLNFFSFRESDFGLLTGIHKLDQDRLIFLFSKSSPFLSMGRDFLEMEQSGRKITIGDGGLFAQDPRELIPTDNNYGACQSKFAFSANHFGYYYPSARQGRIFSFTGQLDPITERGMAPWADMFMPIQLYTHFPTFRKDNENPIHDVGYLTTFDPSYGILYVTKRDFIPREGFPEKITYDEVTNKFYYQGMAISLKDSNYFEDISWTLSYDCANKTFISWHDWHPDWVIQTDNHFMTVKDNQLWIHNDTCESFCNFYGKDFPFELEFVSSDGQTVQVTRSAEWLLNVYNYKNSCRDRFHLLNENFDKMIVHNTEQSSPMLTLVKHPQNPTARLQYPKPNGSGFDVLYTKEENKFRVNQFWDAVRDRGEFDSNEFYIFATDASGYRRVFNPKAIDLQKPERQRKKFRQQLTKVWLAKETSKNHKFIVKLVNLKKYQSVR
jgi:hypothetical protein